MAAVEAAVFVVAVLVAGLGAAACVGGCTALEVAGTVAGTIPVAGPARVLRVLLVGAVIVVAAAETWPCVDWEPVLLEDAEEEVALRSS